MTTLKERFEENEQIQLGFTNLTFILSRPNQKNGKTVTRAEVREEVEKHKALILSFFRQELLALAEEVENLKVLDVYKAAQIIRSKADELK